MESILKPEQKMYVILLMASGLRDEYAEKEEKKTDYQIASRIYASAFAGMIRYGFPLFYEEKDGLAFLDMDLEGHKYSCPARTIKNTLRAEFASIEEKLPEILPLLEAEEKWLISAQRSRKRRGKGNEDMQEIPVVPDIKAEPEDDIPSKYPSQAEQPCKAGESVQADQDLEPMKGSELVPQDPASWTETAKEKKSYEDRPELFQDSVPRPFPGILGNTEAEEPVKLPAAGDRVELSGKGSIEKKETQVLTGLGRVQVQLRQEAAHIQPESAPQETDTSGPVYHAFQKKERTITTLRTANGAEDEAVKEAAQKIEREEASVRLAGTASGADVSAVKPESERKPMGVLSRFLPKSKRQEIRNAVQAAPELRTQMSSTEPDVIPQIPEEVPGEQICHTHYVILKKTYGTQVAGPYTIQIWPTEVIEMHPGQVPSGIFIRAKAPNGTVVCRTGDIRTKYVVLEIDRKQFNVFGFWENGVFTTMVATINTTASMYTMSEEIERECPEHVSDSFLDQFRSKMSKRLEFFVVPVENVSHGESCVPIAAFVRVGDNNYVINNKGEGNKLRFTYDGELSEISGRWEGRKFLFSIRPVEQE